MRLVQLGLICGLAACTEIPTSGGGPALGNAAPGAQQAYFASYPEHLYGAADVVCTGPGQSVVRRGAHEVRCESLPDPESAAAIILQFGGTVEDLPRFVIEFSGRNTSAGYLVTADNFIHVPLRDGGAQEVHLPDPRVKAELAEVLEAAGGRPL